jgi:tRNA dimethylallyltransferase
MDTILTIVGPTGAGKTALAVALAKKNNGEIISADSRQVYKHMNIGTAKPSVTEQQEVRFHLIDTIEPDQAYSCGQFARDAENLIAEITGRGRMPIVCGGTGLYIKALFYPLHALPQPDSGIKKELMNSLLTRGIAALYRELREVDPEWASRIKPADKQRILRGLEVYRMTGKPLTDLTRGKRPKARYKPRFIGLNLPRLELYRRINERFDRMIMDGLVRETEVLLEKGYPPDCNGLRTIGYREIVEYLQGKTTLSEAVKKAKQRTRNYAKRQITWFLKIPGVKWLDPRIVPTAAP